MSIPGHATADPQMLCPCMRLRWLALKSAAKELLIDVVLIETLRDVERQAHYVATGVSQTMKSWHLPQKPNGLALAFDAAPRPYLSMKLWNPGGSAWQALGQISETLGMTWGGSWLGWKDPSHHEIHACDCPPKVSK